MTSTLRFNLGDVRLRDEERRELQKFSRKLIELKANHTSDRKPSDPRAFSRCARLTGEGRGRSKTGEFCLRERWGNRPMQNSRNFSPTLLLGVVVVANAAKCQWLWPCLRLRPGFCLWFGCA